MRSRELAERIGITEQNVSLLKSGKVRGIRFDTLDKICEALDCQPGDILERPGGGRVAKGAVQRRVGGRPPFPPHSPARCLPPPQAVRAASSQRGAGKAE